MLNFTVLKSSADAKRYYAPHGHDYWIEDKDHRAFFGGKLAERLGLGEFDLDQFHDLCDGVVPGSRTAKRPDGEKLTVGRKDTSRAGWDVTVDGPKDLGVLIGLGLDDRIIPEVLERAGRDVLAAIEKDAKTRVRIGKQDTDRPTGEIAYTAVLHTTARPVGDKIDIQPHYHFLIANATWDSVEKKYKALQLQPYALNGEKEARPYYTAFLNAKLAEYMQGLGYEVEPDRKTGSFRVVGIPETVRKEFSQRTNKIEAVAAMLEKQKQKFLGDPDAKLNPATKARLGARTREARKPGKTWDSLLDHWESRVTPTELKVVRETVARADMPLALEDRARDAVDWSLRHLLERDSVVSQRSVVTEALKYGLGSVTPESVFAEVGRRRDLIRRADKGGELVSTRWVLAEENGITDWAVKGRGRCRPLSSSVTRGPGKNDLVTLSVSQQAAVRHVWNSPDRLILIRGAAGTGKTTLTRTALAGVNVPWVILAPSAEASRGVLRRDGFTEADTLAAFLNTAAMQQKVKNGLIWLDEASLTGAHDMARLVQLADQLKARIVLSGDRRQHKSVSRGDILAMLEDKAGCPAAEVGEIRRQSGEYREVVKMLAAGSVGAAFEKLDGMGWIKEAMPMGEPLEPGSKPPEQSIDLNRMIATDYLKAINEDRTVLVVCPTHAEGKDVTAELRNVLREAGKIGRVDHQLDTLVNLNLTAAELEEVKKERPAGVVVARYGAYRPEKLRLAVGDSIRMTANVKDVTGKHRINNGGVYGITGFTEGGDIRLDNGWVLGKDTQHITHGYVVTSHAAQGRTVDHVLVAMPASTFPAVGREAAYVSVSRGRHGATIFTDDKLALQDAWCREDHRLLASDLVRESKKGIRQRLKRHVAWLRSVTNRGMDKALGREPERGLIYGRE